MGPIGLTTAKRPLEARVSIGDVNCSTMCARSVATGHHELGGWCECGHVLDTEGGKTYAQELHMETARSRTTIWPPTHCLRICATGDCAAPAAACFWLVKLVDTARHDGKKQRQFGPSVLSHRHESTEGRKDVGELLMKNVFRKMLLKTCFRTCFFQSLGVTRHVPFMVWRDWPDWSDDSEVSTGGKRLDRRRENCSTVCVRSVAAGQQETNWGGRCECGEVLDTEGERHMPRSCTWKRRGRAQRGGLSKPLVCEPVQMRSAQQYPRAGRTRLRDHNSRQGSSGSSKKTP